ncbi:hypothetical protein [Escherichia phage REP7]|uniref:Uncharacterized protein n=1 Tax=Escherichia phage REP5 TaxID=3022458 RepID=A0AAF0B060_9CAUD|nr:hypothetical protein [Escherichia phage REP5]WBY53476.1 hypothetical protein [Escherichia phage REP6]WBY53604.1 hypothetical protein [Escherichia phage REP7]
MATIRATANEFGFSSLDVKFDIVGTDNAFEMVKGLISQTIKGYNPSEKFWEETKQEVLKDGYTYHYWGEKLSPCTTTKKALTNRRNGAK